MRNIRYFKNVNIKEKKCRIKELNLIHKKKLKLLMLSMNEFLIKTLNKKIKIKKLILNKMRNK